VATIDVSSVFVGPVTMFPTAEEPGGVSQITIEMTRKAGGPGGPRVIVDAGVPMNADTSLRDFQLALLERTLVLLRRIADETPESLYQKWVKACDEANADQSSTVSVDGGVTISVKGGA
jgi:hypothetical protein